jgi:hypothetical protein
MTTSRQINAALKREGLPLVFNSTRDGYQYFTTDASLPYDSYSVYTCYVSDLTVDQWLDCARTFADIIKQQEQPT